MSPHAAAERERRHIPVDAFEAVLTSPEQIVSTHGGLMAYQSRAEIEGRTYLIRAIVDDSTEPRHVVTVYRTSKIAKYWRRV